jgi:hypothetical protein
MMSGFTGHKVTPDISDQVASKIQEIVVTTVTTTYIAVAPVGTLQSEAKWSCRKVVSDTATGITIVTWAESAGLGGATERFVHVATDLTALTYS